MTRRFSYPLSQVLGIIIKINNISGRGQGTRASSTCAIGISRLRDNCITVVGGMRIIVHVQQWLLNLRCLGVATRYRKLVIENMKSISS